MIFYIHGVVVCHGVVFRHDKETIIMFQKQHCGTTAGNHLIALEHQQNESFLSKENCRPGEDRCCLNNG